MSDRAILIIVAALAILAGVAARHWSAAGSGDWQGSEAAFPDFEGKSTQLSDLSSKALVVNFWASWCEPCREEIPELNRLYEELRPRGLNVVGIALDDRDAVMAFLRKYPVSYPILMGARGGDALAAKFGDHDGVLPFTVVLDTTGRVVRSHLGPQSRAGFLADVEPLLEPPRSGQ